MDDQQQRRAEDTRAPGEVDWSDTEGASLLGESSTVYLFRRKDGDNQKWTDIRSSERLDFVRDHPEAFKLRTLFTVPVADLARAPIAHVARARTDLDMIERRAAKLERRINDRLPGVQLDWDDPTDLLDMKAGANELQSAVERATRSSMNFMQMRTQDAAAAVSYAKYLAILVGAAQEARCTRTSKPSDEASFAAPQAGAGKVEVPEADHAAALLVTLYEGEEIQNAARILIEQAIEIEGLRAMLAASLAAPVAEKEQSIEDRPENEQEWAKVDPATAFHLIERHAENWADAGRMMLAWRDANPAPATGEGQQQDEPVAYLKFWARQAFGNPEFGPEHDEGFEVCREGDIGDDGVPAFPVYTRASLSSPAKRQESEAERDTPESMANSNARFAIDGAIAFGREGVNKPPNEDHWLYEYWSIGRQLSKLGETSGWDNVTPVEAPAQKDELAIAITYALTGYTIGDGSKGDFKDVVCAIEREVRARLAAPSSPSVEIGTVDTKELASLIRKHAEVIYGLRATTQDTWAAIIANINQYAAQVAKAAREEAYEEAAVICDKEDGGDAYGDAALSNAAKAIRALRTPQPAADTEQGVK